MSQPPSLPSPSPLPVPPMPVVRRRMPLWGWMLLASGLLVVGLAIGLLGWAVVWGWNLFEEQAQAALQADPAVQEQIGQIREMEVQLVATGNAVGSDEFVFKLEGSQGSGTVLVEFSSTADSEQILGGELTMEDGSKHALRASTEYTD